MAIVNSFSTGAMTADDKLLGSEGDSGNTVNFTVDQLASYIHADFNNRPAPGIEDVTAGSILIKDLNDGSISGLSGFTHDGSKLTLSTNIDIDGATSFNAGVTFDNGVLFSDEFIVESSGMFEGGIVADNGFSLGSGEFDVSTGGGVSFHAGDDISFASGSDISFQTLVIFEDDVNISSSATFNGATEFEGEVIIKDVDGFACEGGASFSKDVDFSLIPSAGGSKVVTEDSLKYGGFEASVALGGDSSTTVADGLYHNSGILRDPTTNFYQNYGDDFENWYDQTGNIDWGSFGNHLATHSSPTTIGSGGVIPGQKILDTDNTKILGKVTRFSFDSVDGKTPEVQRDKYHTFSFVVEPKASDSYIGVKVGSSRGVAMINVSDEYLYSDAELSQAQPGDNNASMAISTDIPDHLDGNISGTNDPNESDYDFVSRKYIEHLGLYLVTLTFKTTARTDVSGVNVFLIPIATNNNNFANQLTNSVTTGNNLFGLPHLEVGTASYATISSRVSTSPYLAFSMDPDKLSSNIQKTKFDGAYAWNNFDESIFDYDSVWGGESGIQPTSSNGQSAPISMGNNSFRGCVDLSSLELGDSATIKGNFYSSTPDTLRYSRIMLAQLTISNSYYYGFNILETKEVYAGDDGSFAADFTVHKVSASANTQKYVLLLDIEGVSPFHKTRCTSIYVTVDRRPV